MIFMNVLRNKTLQKIIIMIAALMLLLGNMLGG